MKVAWATVERLAGSLFEICIRSDSSVSFLWHLKGGFGCNSLENDNRHGYEKA